MKLGNKYKETESQQHHNVFINLKDNEDLFNDPKVPQDILEKMIKKELLERSLDPSKFKKNQALWFKLDFTSHCGGTKTKINHGATTDVELKDHNLQVTTSCGEKSNDLQSKILPNMSRDYLVLDDN
jgi:hypothetical protein